MQAIDGVFYVAILIMSVVVHEFAHGYMAYRLGDQTARLAGRLTLNPLKHLDLFGSIILPLLLILSRAGFVLGWARPVPYNPENLTNKKKGKFLVAIAGIVANVIIAVIFGLFIRFAPSLGLLPPYSADPLLIHPFYHIAISIFMVNSVLALFNLVPIPPLDGSKILFSFLPAQYQFIENFLERWGMFILLFFIVFLWSTVAPLVFSFFHLITGLYLY